MISKSERYRRWNLLLLILSVLTFTTPTVLSYSIKTEPQDVWIESGSPARLLCKFDVSAKSCAWNYNGVKIDTDAFWPDYVSDKNVNGNCDLRIKSVSLQRDDGNWSCLLPRSMEKDGLPSRTARLTVLVVPTPPVISHKGNTPSVLTARDGSTATLNCQTEHGHPATNFSWQMENKTDKETPTSSEKEDKTKLVTTFTELKLAIRKNDTGKIVYCVGQHGKRRFYTGVTLDVQYESSYVNISPTGLLRTSVEELVTLQCSSDGNPLPKYQWKHASSNTSSWRTVSTEANYILTIREDNGGKYRCEAGNKYLLRSEELTIIVQEKQNTYASLLITGLVCAVFVFLLSVSLAVYLRFFRKKTVKPAFVGVPQIDSQI